MADLGGLSDTAKDFADSDTGEEVTDSCLDKAKGEAGSVTGGKYVDKIRRSGRHIARTSQRDL